MVVNDELIACYIDGTCSPDEKEAVIKHLLKHPAEYEHIITMMDLFRRVPETNHCQSNIETNQDSYCDIAMSAAAFAPIAHDSKLKSTGINLEHNKELIDRALTLFSEIEDRK